MRLYEFLTEGRGADLYHGTDFYSADQILKQNVMKAKHHLIHSSLPQSFRGHDKTVSFTRVMPVAKWFVDDNDDIGVIFVIDEAKLYRDVGKRMRPHEHEVPDDISPEERTDRSTQQSEHEEMVYGDIPNISSYIKQIFVFIPKGRTTREALSELKYYKILYDPRTTVVRSHKQNLTGRQFMQLLNTNPKTTIDTSKIKKPDEPI